MNKFDIFLNYLIRVLNNFFHSQFSYGSHQNKNHFHNSEYLTAAGSNEIPELIRPAETKCFPRIIFKLYAVIKWICAHKKRMVAAGATAIKST